MQHLFAVLIYMMELESRDQRFLRFFFGYMLQGGTTFVWPDAAVPAVTALEKAAHDTLSSDSKYNQKMRTLLFNLKVRYLTVCLFYVLHMLEFCSSQNFYFLYH